MPGSFVADPLPLDRELKGSYIQLIRPEYVSVADPLPLDRELKVSFPQRGWDGR